METWRGNGKRETIQIKEGELGAENLKEAPPQKSCGAITVHRELAAKMRKKLKFWLVCGE